MVGTSNFKAINVIKNTIHTFYQFFLLREVIFLQKGDWDKSQLSLCSAGHSTLFHLIIGPICLL